MVNSVKLIERAPGQLAIEGVMMLDTVDSLALQMDPFWRKKPESIDLSLKGVQRSDSAALSLLVEFIRIAHRRKIGLTFSDLPQPMLDLCRVVGVDTLIKDFHG